MKVEYVGKCLLMTSENGEKTLAIGDLHLGYEGAMRKAGMMVPVKLYKKCFDDFNEIINKIPEKIDNIVVLGDLKHEFGTILPEEWNNIINFIKHLKKSCDKLIVIEGNHDVILFPILRKIGVESNDFFVWNDCAFMHGDKDFEEIHSKKIKYWVIGHGHPAIILNDGTKKEKYKCFLEGKYKGKKITIVPSFFPLKEGTDPRENEMKFAWKFDLMNFKVHVVSDDLKVLEFVELGKIN